MRPKRSHIDAVLLRTMPPGSLEQIVFRMDAVRRWEAQGTPIVNSPQSVEAAVDKYLATALLAAAGLRVPRTTVCETANQACEAFEMLDRDVVLKPLFGSGGKDIERIQDAVTARVTFQQYEQQGSVIYQQQFIRRPHRDLRVLVVGDELLAVQRTNVDDWRKNISRGGVATPARLSPQLADAARRAAAAVGTIFAGVDLIETDDAPYVIEVNSAPAWRGLSAATEVDVAAMVLGLLEQVANRRTAA